jgi:hypothetical protein
MARGPRKAKPGVSMGGLEETPARKKRRTKARRREEQRWAAKAGPVTIYHRDSETGEEREPPAST